LTGVSDFSLRVIKQTGQIEVFGRENVFKATDEVGESILEAYHVADNWVAGNLESEAADDLEADDGST
jgi:hypothetical protein